MSLSRAVYYTVSFASYSGNITFTYYHYLILYSNTLYITGYPGGANMNTFMHVM